MSALAIVTVLFLTCARAQLQAQSCSISCPGNPSLLGTQPENVGPIQGRPGKRGALGPPGLPGERGGRGPKGDQGEGCNCKALKHEIGSLRESMLHLKHVYLTSMGWSEASNKRWYRIVRSKSTFAAARELCKSYGAKLAHAGMKNSSIIREVMSVTGLKQGEFAWIGLTDIVREGIWVWEDGTNDPSSNWGPGQPNNHGSNEDCARFWENYKFNDIRCNYEMHALCETDMI